MDGKQIKLLDCTLRDGGYVNDWNFGQDNLVSVLERLVSAGVDFIELGFLDERQPFDIDRSIMPSTGCMRQIYGRVEKRGAQFLGMIDYGTCGIENLQPASESYLDGIRVIFKKQKMREAMAFCRQVKELGYKVFSQLVSITSYSDEELLELIDLVNEVQPYAVSMVDTYGLLHQDSLLHYFEMLDRHVNEDIGIGYHSHNNFQLGYANCIQMMQSSCRPGRPVMVDGTLYGMGKSAGNAPLELLAMHMNERYEKHYDISQLLEAIDGNIMRIYQEHYWGYSLFFYLAASNNCHPSYVKFLMDKHTLSMRSINEILSQLQGEKKLLYEKEYIEKLYYGYQQKECDDEEDRRKLKEALAGKELLLVGPGKNIQAQAERVEAYIAQKRPVVISVNFIPGSLQADYVFLSNPRRYIRLNNDLKEYKNRKTKVIATSNVTRTEGTFDYTLNNSALLDETAETVDNSFIMLLKALHQIGVSRAACAGFDGYSENEDNYFNPNMEYWFAKRKAGEFNAYVRQSLAGMQEELSVTFITDSHYAS